MRYAIYMRVACGGQLSDNDCDPQQEMLMNYAEQNGLEVVGKYSDLGFSGNDTNRPGLQAMTADYAAGKFEKVLALDVSRLSRKRTVFPFPIETVK